MQKTIGILCFLALLISCTSPKTETFNVDDALQYCDVQAKRTLSELGKATKMPRNIPDSLVHWNLVPISVGEWTVGFWPGILWYNYENTKCEEMKKQAVYFTELLEPITKHSAHDHDLGFQIFCSYGNAYRLTGNPAYKQIILNAADTVATLFNPTVGTMLSWPREVKPRNWPHNTIIDNMMNLEMLFWAAKNGGNPELYDMAVAHATTTMNHHFREDGSSFHVVVYDTITGDFIKGVTHQGYADETMWARGQAWAIYGYTLVYRETQDPVFLRFAEKVSDIFLERLPEDYVPYWDFDAPNIPNEPKDASASAITASALLELSQLTDDEAKAKKYKEVAIKMLESLSSANYQSRESKPSFLLRSTGHKPNGYEINASINYADYYYIEALNRLKQMNQ